MAAIKAVKEEIIAHAITSAKGKSSSTGKQSQEDLKKLASEMPQPPSIITLAELFGLSPFETKIILLLAGMELDSDFATRVSSLHGENAHFQPTFGLALAAFKDAHWSALSPEAPLRYWHLVKLTDPQLLTRSPLQISERVLHYLTGIQHLDDLLSGIVEPYPGATKLVGSHQKIADDILKTIIPANEKGSLPVILLNGIKDTDKPAIAARVCDQLNIRLYCMSSTAIPDQPKELNTLARIWNRESALSTSALYINCNEAESSNPATLSSVKAFSNKIQSLLFLDSHHWSPVLSRSVITFEIDTPTENEQVELWKISLNSHFKKVNGSIQNMVAQFNMTSESIKKTASEIVAQAASAEKEGKPVSVDQLIWLACCKSTRSGLDELTQRIIPMVTWDDLIIPENQRRTLHEIAMHVRQKSKVYNDWGFASKTSRGLGISALFTGDSGTGKTMASEVLANELQLDLYRIDLSQVVNKYIGETEKNLKKIFDAADKGGAILLFDEADALFGKRSDVKDSHDRYANIEVSYLLQRMETYRGLAILTTNLKTSLDKAFMRRLRFVVQFPFPDASQRTEIWKRVFPSETPTENLDIVRLSKLNVSGGNIRNIAMNAAFIAADEKKSVEMSHIHRAARSEYAKLEKPMSASESGSWL